MQKSKNKSHWFESVTGRQFYAVKFLGRWRLLGKKGYILYEDDYFSDLKDYAKTVFGFDYVGYM